jgi:alpha-galactosidase
VGNNPYGKSKVKYLAIPFIFSALSLGVIPGHSQNPSTASLDLWKGDQPPFYFKYDGKESPTFLSTWQKTQSPVTPSEGGETHHYTYTDPATKLKIAADVRTFTDFDAIEWILHITNGGSTDSPILEDIQPLFLSIASDSTDVVFHCAGGSNQSLPDFIPIDSLIPPGKSLLIGSDRGRSSDGGAHDPLGYTGAFPFFNLQTGDHGIIGAIGWTGSWLGHVDRSMTGQEISLHFGFLKTHFLLHPGETIRTARILLMNWKGGDVAESQNMWRRLILAHYSPKDPHDEVLPSPICFCSGGAEPITTKLAAVNFIHDKKIPADLYWIDAGWYGNDPKLQWTKQRGSWSPNKTLFPDGFKPLGEALKAANVGFLVWVEAETAMPGSNLATQHADWLIHPDTPVNEDQPYMLYLGNPAALKYITDTVSNLITEGEWTWYRQDFNFYPDVYFAAHDTPERIGMTEIQHIEGLYAYWDALLAQHPGLRIDNCASGGRRLDLEMISRSYALHRSDYAGIPLGEQVHTLGLAPWVPLNDGIIGNPATDASSTVQLYNNRSGYSSGINMAIDPKNFSNDAVIDVSRSVLQEFLSVRPYTHGDYYCLFPYSLEHDVWTAIQWNRPDLKSGVLVLLRRDTSLYASLQVDLHAIDPNAQYEVEIRHTLAKGQVQQMSGKNLAHLNVTILGRPGSALVFYKQL